MEGYRAKWVYGTISAAVCVAMLFRTCYIYYNEEEFAEHPDKKRLDFRFFFTQITIINK